MVSRFFSRCMTSAGEAASKYAPSGYPRHRPKPATSCPCRVSSCRPWSPFFGGNEAVIGKTCIPAQLLLVLELGQKCPPELEQYPGLFSLLEPPPAGAGAAIPPGQLAPLRTRPKDPK